MSGRRSHNPNAITSQPVDEATLQHDLMTLVDMLPPWQPTAGQLCTDCGVWEPLGEVPPQRRKPPLCGDCYSVRHALKTNA